MRIKLILKVFNECRSSTGVGLFYSPRPYSLSFQSDVQFNTHMLHAWNIYQHWPEQNHPNVGKYTIHGAYGTGVRLWYSSILGWLEDGPSQVKSSAGPWKKAKARPRQEHDEHWKFIQWIGCSSHLPSGYLTWWIIIGCWWIIIDHWIIIGYTILLFNVAMV